MRYYSILIGKHGELEHDDVKYFEDIILLIFILNKFRQ